MKTIHVLVTTVVLWAAGFGVVHASDPTALYARVDKVVLEPGAGAPTAIQVWGVFSMAKPDDRNFYLPAARGYLYFKLAGNPDAARQEWADLKAVAGTGQIVSFGSRYQLKAQLRKADQQPEHPDPYVVSIGITKVRGNTDYEPIRALLAFKG
jgi:hypothetical protein